MTTLHLLSHPSAYDDALLSIGGEDVIVLLGEGVYLQAMPDRRAQLIESSARLVILGEDATIRGISVAAVNEKGDARIDTETIGYADLVVLCAEHQPIVSWG